MLKITKQEETIRQLKHDLGKMEATNKLLEDRAVDLWGKLWKHQTDAKVISKGIALFVILEIRCGNNPGSLHITSQ